jgi:hypothetical protein
MASQAWPVETCNTVRRPGLGIPERYRHPHVPGRWDHSRNARQTKPWRAKHCEMTQGKHRGQARTSCGPPTSFRAACSFNLKPSAVHEHARSLFRRANRFARVLCPPLPATMALALARHLARTRPFNPPPAAARKRSRSRFRAPFPADRQRMTFPGCRSTRKPLCPASAPSAFPPLHSRNGSRGFPPVTPTRSKERKSPGGWSARSGA